MLSEGSQNREESEPADQIDQPMRNPYEQPSRHAEAAGTGRSFKEEEPADQWEQQRSSTGSPESQGQDVIPPQDQDDPMGEEVVDLWAAEDEEDYVAQQATRSSI